VSGWQGEKPHAASGTGGSDVYNCVPEGNGDVWNQNKTTALTWNDGVARSTLIGVDLIAVTGYSTSAKLSIACQASHRRCGRGGDPGDTPYVLAARP
jgi:hypothetical protein